MSERILIVDDNKRVLETFARNLARIGYVVLTASGGEEALAVYARERPKIALVDVRMPRVNGFDVLQAIRTQDPDAEVILITGHGDIGMAINALRAGASDFVQKPVDTEMLIALLGQAEERLRLKQDLSVALTALEQHAADLEAQNAELDAFAHTVAHSIKTPLSVVVGLAEVLEMDMATIADEEQRRSLRTIAERSRRMARVVDELLLLASVHQTAVQTESLDMKGIVAEVQRRLEHEMDLYGAELVVPDAWPTVLGYAPWLEEVWTNYISNALKYGGQPTRIELGVDEVAQADKLVRFWVKDNGPGIAPQDQERLFIPFTRIDQAIAQGHGLGLSITQRIVGKLGGEVGVESEIGAGSLFWFTLPRA